MGLGGGGNWGVLWGSEGLLTNGTFKDYGLTNNGGIYPTGNYALSDLKRLPH